MVAPAAHREASHAGIVTPEAVLLEFAEAGLGSRALGFLVDLGVRLGILWGILTVVGAGGALLSEAAVVMVVIVSSFLILLVYPVVCETFWNGKTVGKMLVGLRVVTVEGAPVRFRHAAIRAALGLVDFLVGLGAVAILSALGTRRSQRLGDLAAGTIVIRERKDGGAAQPILFQPPTGWEAYAGALDVGPLSDEDYVVVRSFLLRVHELQREHRDARAGELARYVAAKLRVEVPAGHAPETFLVVVAAAYQVRHGGPVAATASTGWRGGVPGIVPPPVWRDDEPATTWGTPGASTAPAPTSSVH